MTNAERAKIWELRLAGDGYKKIAAETGISVNTIKAYCKRNNIERTTEDIQLCKNCGKVVTQTPGRKRKLFCNDSCRQHYWSIHRNEMKPAKKYVCKYCGKEFMVYGNTKRKYCSEGCYFKDRFYAD